MLLYTCSLGDPEALLWSVDNGSRDTQMPTVLAHSGAESDKSSVVECMDWQSAGSMLATGSMDGWVRVWSKSGAACLLLPSTLLIVLRTRPHAGLLSMTMTMCKLCFLYKQSRELLHELSTLRLASLHVCAVLKSTGRSLAALIVVGSILTTGKQAIQKL